MHIVSVLTFILQLSVIFLRDQGQRLVAKDILFLLLSFQNLQWDIYHLYWIIIQHVIILCPHLIPVTQEYVQILTWNWIIWLSKITQYMLYSYTTHYVLCTPTHIKSKFYSTSHWVSQCQHTPHTKTKHSTWQSLSEYFHTACDTANLLYQLIYHKITIIYCLSLTNEASQINDQNWDLMIKPGFGFSKPQSHGGNSAWLC